MSQTVTINDYDCYGFVPHDITGNHLFGNDPVYCAKCKCRLWLDPASKLGDLRWFVSLPVYLIHEEEELV